MAQNLSRIYFISFTFPTCRGSYEDTYNLCNSAHIHTITFLPNHRDMKAEKWIEQEKQETLDNHNIRNSRQVWNHTNRAWRRELSMIITIAITLASIALVIEAP
jgi:hypothetical protein